MNHQLTDMEILNRLYYINLEYRTDLYKSINDVIDNLKFDRNKVTRIEAIPKQNGAYGCALSHIKVLEDAKANGYNKIMILEDDFIPFSYEEMVSKISKFMREVEEWDVLLLSSNVKKHENCGIENVSKVVKCHSTIAYCVSGHYIDKLLSVFRESANELSNIENYAEPCVHCIDVKWGKLQLEDNWFVFNPILGREYPKYSDVQKRYLDHYENI